MQIALINSEHFKEIPSNELIHQRWAKEGKEELAPTVLKCIKNFNDVCYYY